MQRNAMQLAITKNGLWTFRCFSSISLRNYSFDHANNSEMRLPPPQDKSSMYRHFIFPEFVCYYSTTVFSKCYENPVS